MTSRLKAEVGLFVAVGAGGAVGGSARWALSTAVADTPDSFPWSTFVENVSGCLLIGALMALILAATTGWLASPYTRAFLAIGVLGGYTTFSTFAVQVLELLQHGKASIALAYVAASSTVGIAAAWTGLTAAQWAQARWRLHARART